MRREHLPWLLCPHGCGSLTFGSVLATQGDEVLRGTIRCGSGHEFPITNGVVELVGDSRIDLERTAEQFGYEFLEIPDREDSAKKKAEILTLFVAKTGVDPSFYSTPGLDYRVIQDHTELGYEPDLSRLDGKRVLDAGCGSGRFAAIAATPASDLILLDIGPQVHEARRKALEKGTSHVLAIRCDLENIPLASGIVDFCYSIGVVHHLRDPDRGLSEISRVISHSGTLAIWVYPPSYWGGKIRGALTHFIRAPLLRLPLRWQLAFCRWILLPVGRLQLRVARVPGLKWLLAPLFLLNIPRHEDRNEMLATVIDHYLPLNIRTYSEQALSEALETVGFTVDPLPFPTSARAWKGAGSSAGPVPGRGAAPSPGKGTAL